MTRPASKLPRVRRAGAMLPLVAGLVIASLAGTPADALGVEPLGKKWQRGATIAVGGHDAYARPAVDESITALRATGSRHLSLYAEWFMESADASKVAPDAERTQSDESIIHAVEQARSHGMSVSLTPVVRPPVWQGTIAPRRAGKWYRSYRDMVRHYARLAERAEVETLAVGAELRTMTGDLREWKQVIELARKQFGGDLTYSANQIDEATRIGFWKRLDTIGISAYMPLVRDEPNPSVNELVTAWKRLHVERIAKLERQYDRPVLFTEIGYSSREWTAARPWAVSTGAVSQEPQRRAYEALYRVWSRFKWFRGVHWWYWPAGAYDPSNGTPSPRGKAAEQTMRNWNKAR